MREAIKKYSSELLLFLFVPVLLLILFRDLIVNYYPSGDEFALLVNSTSLYQPISISDWFTKGFTQYFTVYPEWAHPNRTILRPVVNLVFYINSLLFGTNYGYYFILSYLFHSLGVVFVFILLKRYFKTGGYIPYLGAFIMLINPSVAASFFYFPSFGFDVLAGVLVCSVYFLVRKDKYVLSMIVLVIALFTKETTIFASAAAGITYYLIHKGDKKKIVRAVVLAALPIVIWFAIRNSLGYFTGDDGTTHHLYNIKSLLSTVMRTLLVLPLGVSSPIETAENLKHLLAFDLGAVNKRFLILLIANIFFYAFTAAYIVKIIKNKSARIKDKEALYILPWAVLAFFELILLGVDVRFAYALYIFLIPLSVYLIYKNYSPTLLKALAILLCVISFKGLYNYYRIADPGSIDAYLKKLSSSEALINEIKSAGDSSNVYIVNDMTAGFGIEWLNEFSGIRSEITKINSLSGAHHGGVLNNIEVYTDSGICHVNVTLSEPNNFEIEGIALDLFAHDPQKKFRRNANITYRFPEEKIIGYTISNNAPKYDLGKKMEIDITNPNKKNNKIIYFSPSSGKYESAVCP